MDTLNRAVARILSFYFDISGSIGVSIVLLTITLLLITAPLTMRSTRKMMAAQRDMQKIQPELKKIQKEFAADRQRMNEEMMKLYQEHGINPFAMVGGCLPMLLQAPFFFALFQVLRGLGNTNAQGVAEPRYLDVTSSLYEKIVGAGGELISFGFDLSETATDSHGGFLSSLPYWVLVVLVGVTAFWQARQMAGRRDPNVPVNPQAQMMQKIFPTIMPLISLNLPAGVVVYFVVSNLFRMGQQTIVHRLEQKAGNVPAPNKGNDSKNNKNGKNKSSQDSKPDPGASAGENGTKGSVTPPNRPHPRSKKKKKRKRK